MTKKSHLHPNALVAKDLTPDRRVIVYNLRFGATEYIVLEPPVAATSSLGPSLKVKLKKVNTGEVVYHYLTTLGATPFPSGSFNPVNYVIDYNDRHLLPNKTLSVSEYEARLGPRARRIKDFLP